MTTRLNLGAGNWRPAGYMSVDIAGADIPHDLRAQPWPFADESAAEILASHVLEHFAQAEAQAFLAECRRVLLPGGVLRLAVPDLDKFIDCHRAGDFAALGGYRWTDLNHFAGGDEREPNPYQRHQYLWCWASLAWTLSGHGYRRVDRVPFAAPHNPAYAAISLYVEARK